MGAISADRDSRIPRQSTHSQPDPSSARSTPKGHANLGRKMWGGATRVASTGQLLRPDEDTLAVHSLMIDDERWTEALEVFNGQFQIVEPHPVAVEINRRAV